MPKALDPHQASSIVLLLLAAAVGCGAPPAGSGTQAPGADARPAPAPAGSPAASATAAPESTGTVSEMGVAQLVVSGAGACARYADGRVRCFGTQAQVDGITDAIDLASDGETACAVRRAGTVHCWGLRPRLQDKDTPSTTPVAVPGLTGVGDIELRYRSLFDPGWCVVSAAGQVRCACRRSRSCSEIELRPVAGAPASVRAFGDTEHGCALTRDKRVWCWNTYGSNSGAFLPELTAVEDLVAYDNAWCARSEDGQVSCWGANNAGQLGRGYITFVGDPDEPPTPPDTPMPLDLRATTLAPGMVITSSGDLRVWGENDDGQRRPDDAGDLSKPVDPQTVPAATAIAAGSDRACAIDGGGQIFCWGAPVPISVQEPHALSVKDAVSIASEGHHVCALRKSGDVACWGQRDGLASPIEPTNLGISGAVELAVSRRSVCVRTREKQARCWGRSGGSDGETIADGVDAIGFVGTTLCLADAKRARCTTKMRGLRSGDAKAAAIDISPLDLDIDISGALSKHPKEKAKPKAPTFYPAGPGGSSGFANVRGGLCFLRSKGVHCLAGDDGRTIRPMANVANAIDLADDAILLADGTLVSTSDPTVRTTASPLRALVGRNQLAIGSDGSVYGYFLRKPAQVTKRADFASITDAIDMTGSGLESSFGCIVRRSGQVSCWGQGANGEVGLGNRRLPRLVGNVTAK